MGIAVYSDSTIKFKNFVVENFQDSPDEFLISQCCHKSLLHLLTTPLRCTLKPHPPTMRSWPGEFPPPTHHQCPEAIGRDDLIMVLQESHQQLQGPPRHQALQHKHTNLISNSRNTFINKLKHPSITNSFDERPNLLLENNCWLCRCCTDHTLQLFIIASLIETFQLYRPVPLYVNPRVCTI